MSFSQRYGYKMARDTIQLEAIDEPLRNGLCSLLELHAWSAAVRSTGMDSGCYLSHHPLFFTRSRHRCGAIPNCPLNQRVNALGAL